MYEGHKFRITIQLNTESLVQALDLDHKYSLKEGDQSDQVTTHGNENKHLFEKRENTLNFTMLFP